MLESDEIVGHRFCREIAPLPVFFKALEANRLQIADNYYVTNEDLPALGNMIADDTGAGADVGGSAGQPLIVTAIDGQQYEPGEPIVLASGAALTGATTGTDNYNDGLFGLEYPGLLGEIGQFASDIEYPLGSADPNALYTVWAGPNDMFLIEDPAQAPAIVQQAVENLGAAIVSLYGMGAQHVLVPNMVDLGATPFGTQSGLGSPPVCAIPGKQPSGCGPRPPSFSVDRPKPFLPQFQGINARGAVSHYLVVLGH